MKNFTNNFKQFTSRLSARWLIMVLMLLVGTSSAWALNQPAKDLYFDNSTSQWISCYVYIGHGLHTSCYDMSRVSGTQYLWKLPSNFNGGNSWDNADGWVVCNEKWWSSKGESIYKFVHHGEKNVTDITKSAWEDNKIYKTNGTGNVTHDNKTTNVYKITSITKYDYKVTINQATGGTLTVEDYDDNTVSNGASKIYLTVLKFSASASSGYDFTEVQIDNGSTTTTISKADLTTKTYTLTSNVTITPVWESLCAKSATEGKGSFSDGTIKLSAKFNTCGDAYIGFQWKKQDDIDWCYTNDGTEKCYKALGEKNKSNAVEETSFTKINNESLSGTYVFRPYIVVGNNAEEWLYGEDFTVPTCVSVVEPAVTMSPADGKVCQGSPVELTLTTRQSGVVYTIGEVEIFESTTTYSFIPNTSSVTVTASSTSACAGTNNKTKEFSISIKSLPEAPTFTSNSMTVCAGEPFTLPKPTNLKEDTEDCIWSVGGKTTTGSQPGISETTFYTAVKNDGCSSSAVEFTVNVNPLPIITISGSEKAVLYEDVTLTATATDAATVKWYEDDVEKGEGLTYVVTSETATSKIVTAKAFLNGCESAVASHTVAFSAETCAPSNQIQIICTSTKSTTTYCYAFYGSNKTEIFGSWPGTKGTASGNVYSWTIENKDNVTIIFNAGKDKNQTDDLTGHKKGKKYFYTFDSSKSKDNTPENYTLTDTEDILSISAPAAKTISVSTTEGEGNIIFSGQVVKTGCDATNEYGFQYSSDEQTWTTVKVGENAAAGTAISNNTVKGLDGTYYVRAYITNDNSTQYGAVTEITVSTTKTPISNVTLNYCDENGGNVGVDPNPMCKGATAYVKLTYTGSRNPEMKWLSDGTPTEKLTKVEGVDAEVWSFEIQGNEQISVELRNDANKDNEDNPTWATSDKLSFTMKEEPVAPYISINPASGVICQGGSATITVTNPTAECSYKLVSEGSKAGFTTYVEGALTYKVNSVDKYYVVAQHNACTSNEYTSNQVAINQIISTSAKISIEPKNQETTPWEPVSITITADEGYIYEVTYTNNNLASVDGVIIKQKGDTYTYYIPRPTGWGEGNAVSVRTPVSYGIKAQLKVDGEANQCDLSFDTATITVKDEKDEDCD